MNPTGSGKRPSAIDKHRSSDDATTNEPSGVGIYGEFVEAELKAQDVRKDSFERRGLAVVTTSGVLVTLILGFAGLSGRARDTFSSTPSKALLAGALVAFVVAAIYALLTNLPQPYEAVKPNDLRSRLREKPIRSEPSAKKGVALTRLDALDDWKAKNTAKGELLFRALLAEVVAVTLLGGAVCAAFIF